VTCLAAFFVDCGVSNICFAVGGQRVMSRLGGMAFGAGFAADVFAGIYRLRLLRLRSAFGLIRLCLGSLVLRQSGGQGRDACRDHGRQSRQKEGYHQGYLQSSHKLLLVRLRLGDRLRYRKWLGSNCLQVYCEKLRSGAHIPFECDVPIADEPLLRFCNISRSAIAAEQSLFRDIK
jgi:hypothetical protein